MLLPIFLIVIGFIALIVGADWLVNGATRLAKKFNVSDLAIGLTIVAFGTSAPELVVSVVAAIKGSSDIVFGNVIGSNNFNLFIILGLCGVIFPISVQSSTAWREIPISIIIAIILALLANDFFINSNTYFSRIDAIICLLAFAGFLYYIFTQMKTETCEILPVEQKKIPTIKIWAYIIFGLVGLVVGGQLVVSNSILIATKLGVSEKIIGLTIIAAGTSLPELVTSLVAALKKNSDIAIGNVIGSNIFNILFILSAGSLIKPAHFNSNFNLDIAILIGGTIFLFVAMLTGTRKKLDRWEAAILLIFYIIYTGYLIANEI